MSRQDEIKRWIAAGYSPAAAAAAVEALEKITNAPAPGAVPIPTVAPALSLKPVENPTVTSSSAAFRTHADRCGDVGDTGAHGDLGSNAKDQC